MKKGFKPVYGSNSEVLILGSFPSVPSLNAGFYYGNKRNRFWQMLQEVFNEKISDEIQDKINFLLKHNIALWDVVQQTTAKSSMDKELELSNNSISDFTFLLPPNTKVQKILCNGKTAFNMFNLNYKTNIPTYCMPSTSPANPRYDFSVWKTQLEFLKN